MSGFWGGLGERDGGYLLGKLIIEWQLFTLSTALLHQPSSPFLLFTLSTALQHLLPSLHPFFTFSSQPYCIRHLHPFYSSPFLQPYCIFYLLFTLSIALLHQASRAHQCNRLRRVQQFGQSDVCVESGAVFSIPPSLPRASSLPFFPSILLHLLNLIPDLWGAIVFY